jgi:hypothetical protein
MSRVEVWGLCDQVDGYTYASWGPAPSGLHPLVLAAVRSSACSTSIPGCAMQSLANATPSSRCFEPRSGYLLCYLVPSTLRRPSIWLALLVANVVVPQPCSCYPLLLLWQCPALQFTP